MAFLIVESLSHNKSSTILQNAIRALEVVLLSAGLISTVLMVKAAFNMPYSCEFVFSNFLGFWNLMKCLLSSPLYMCIIINSMVVLIAATSTFHRHETDDNQDYDFIKESPLLSSPPPPPLPPPLPPTNTAKITPQPQRRRHVAMPQIKPALKSIKNEDDTMEATWDAITGGGKQKPKEKHLKKCDTWEVRTPAPLRRTAGGALLRKSETFNDARRGLIRRDPSVGLDELNEQVEAFIKKFNENMRLQRQESDQRFLDMVNRGL